MKRLVLILLCALPGSAVQILAAPAPKPNIVFFLTDDLGQRDLGRYGSTFYGTPTPAQERTHR